MSIEITHNDAMEALDRMRLKKSHFPSGVFEWISDPGYVLLHLPKETRVHGSISTDVGRLAPDAFRYLVDGGHLIPEKFTNMFRLSDCERGGTNGDGKEPI